MNHLVLDHQRRQTFEPPVVYFKNSVEVVKDARSRTSRDSEGPCNQQALSTEPHEDVNDCQ